MRIYIIHETPHTCTCTLCYVPRMYYSCVSGHRDNESCDECKFWAHSLPTPKNGNPTWRKHVNIFHRYFLVSLIHQMAMHCVPLQEEGVCEIATQLVNENLKEYHNGLLTPTRWNGVRNADGSTTGNVLTHVRMNVHNAHTHTHASAHTHTHTHGVCNAHTQC